MQRCKCSAATLGTVVCVVCMFPVNRECKVQRCSFSTEQSWRKSRQHLMTSKQRTDFNFVEASMKRIISGTIGGQVQTCTSKLNIGGNRVSTLYRWRQDAGLISLVQAWEKLLTKRSVDRSKLALASSTLVEIASAPYIVEGRMQVWFRWCKPGKSY